MPITIDTLNEIFAETQNDMDLIISQSKEDFYRPEIERETVKMWLSLPQILREAITERNPRLASDLNNKAEQFRKGEVNYGIRE